jgi:light-regulated signal transduction histidine kinase (bacteriophytochrome)
LASERERDFESQSQFLETLASQVATGIRNALLHEEVERHAVELDRRVTERTAQLEAANAELEAFSYSVSHDLRVPLRHIGGFAELLTKRAAPALDEKARRYLTMISGSASQMGRLIEDLLAFSRIGRGEMQKSPVDLSRLVSEIKAEAESEAKGREIHWTTGPLPTVQGNPAMLRLVFSNLISNALKFTRPRDMSRIEIGSLPGEGFEVVVYIRDNGVGFDMRYADKLFGVFQRLHSSDQFEGTGIGLASVRRIIHRHGGRTWAEGSLDAGATFYVSFPQPKEGTP